MKQKTKESIFDNLAMPLIKDIIIGVLSLGVGVGTTLVYSDQVKYHDVISIDSVSTIIDTYLVKTGLVDEGILELSTPQEQIEMISSVLEKQDNLSSDLRSVLVSAGYNENEINALDAEGLAEILTGYGQKLEEENAEKSQLVSDYEALEEKYSLLSSKPIAELSNPPLMVQGENVDTTLKDYLAVVDGKNYYQETLLNSYILDEKLSLKDGVLYYADSAPERVKAITDAVLHDYDRFELQKESSEYVMGTKKCTYGFVNMQWGNGCAEVYIECGGQYSKLEFGLGHVNDSGEGDKTLNIYYLNADGEYELTYTKELRPDMAYEEGISVDIFNTNTVKVEFLGSYGGVRYGMSDVYLVK